MPEPINAELRARLAAICPILDDQTSRRAYARDLWPIGHIAAKGAALEQVGPEPWLVACPRDEAEVSAVVTLAHAERIPVIPWGEGSGVCGGTVAVRGGIALDLKRLDRIERIDRCSLTITVQCGLNGQLLEAALEREGLTLGHSPSSILCSTVGGWLAARSAGQFSTLYGKIEDMVLSLRVVLPSGQRVETVTAPRAATGPDWNQIFVGSEGTLGVITAATLRVHRAAASRVFQAYHVPGVSAGLGVFRELLQSGIRPYAARLYDPLDTLLVGHGHDHPPRASDEPPVGREWPLSGVSFEGLSKLFSARLPRAAERLGKRTALTAPAITNALADRIAGRCLMLLGFEGQSEVVALSARLARELALERGQATELGAEPAELWWRNRHAVSFKQSEVFGMGAFSDTMEVATTWDRIEELYATVRAALAPHAVVLAHFSHAYHSGCSIYFSVAVRCRDQQEALERYRELWRAGLDAVVRCGAAVSHHHGVGLLKAEAFKRSLGPLHGTLVQLKQSLDPANILNPGKLGLP